MTRDEELHLVALAQAGDRDAADRFVRQWTRLMWKLAHAFHRRNPSVSAEDFAQHGWLFFWSALLRFDPSRGSRLHSYALKASRKAMIREEKRARSKRRASEHVGFDIDETRIDPIDHRVPTPTPMESLSSQATVVATLSILTPRQRQAVSLLSDGNSPAQAAAVMGVTRQAVEHLRNHAATKLLKTNILRSA